MKKTTFTLLLSLSCCWLAAQCPTGDIYFSTQGQIDSFPINYPGCKNFPGFVIIGGFDINNVNGLLGVQSIAGFLHIGGGDDGTGVIYLNPLLENLHGLDSLSYIGGYLSIYGNNELKTLDGLENLDSIGSSLVIGSVWDEEAFSNEKLESIAALSNLSKIKGGLYVAGNWLLPNLHGLENIKSLHDLELNRCQFDSLHGLSNLQKIDGSFYFRYNVIENFEGLNSLKSIKRDFRVENNFVLKNFQGLKNLKSIGSNISFSLRIEDNQGMESLKGLDSVDLSQVEEMIILSNPQLFLCNTPSICDYLSNGGTATISDNAPGCNSVAEIEAACIVSIEETSTGESVITFSPNPASDFLQIQISDHEKWDISLFDLRGRQMFRQVVSGSQTVSLRDWPAGLHTLRAVSGERVFSGKIVKQ